MAIDHGEKEAAPLRRKKIPPVPSVKAGSRDAVFLKEATRRLGIWLDSRLTVKEPMHTGRRAARRPSFLFLLRRRQKGGHWEGLQALRNRSPQLPGVLPLVLPATERARALVGGVARWLAGPRARRIASDCLLATSHGRVTRWIVTDPPPSASLEPARRVLLG